MKRKLTLFLLIAALLLTLNGCAQDEAADIIILYTNDVHCSLDGDIGYSGLAAYKEQAEARTPYVALVDCGDAIQGNTIGTVSEGEYPVEIMNRLGYDFAVLGNHEFSYGMDRLSELLGTADAQYLGCNILYTGTGENPVSELEPFAIAEYGDTKVGFIGVSTPESIVKSSPSYFEDSSGELVYSFSGGSIEELCGRVQEAVDECIEAGADYVVALSHLGDDESSEPFRSADLIAGTHGIDAVLDGHAHSEISCDVVENSLGEPVLLSSTGAGLANIGQLVITSGGTLTTGLIGSYPYKDSSMDEYIDGIMGSYESTLNESVGSSDFLLTDSSETGTRLIRSRETNLGDFCADAYRFVSGADIAFVNGGGIRACIEPGDVTYEDIISVQPYGNTLCVAEVTGAEILDALETASRSVLPEAGMGENGGFLQVSGLRYTIDTSVESTVQLDDAGMFVSCGDSRRVCDVEVLQADGSYAPIDPDGTYTLASQNYLIKQGGDGLNMFEDNVLTVDEGIVDYQILITYISDYLGGTIGGEYAEPQGRITVK